MADYLETHYSRAEYGEKEYPQRLCDFVVEKFIQPHVGDVRRATVLDVGSGRGNHLVGFARRGLSVIGLDKRPECLGVLEQFDIRECDLERHPFPCEANSIDVVFSKSVIEHVENADLFLSETRRVLKPSGLAILMTPDWQTQAHMFWDDYTHVKPWTRKGLQNALKIHNFQDINCFLFRQLPLLWKYPLLEYVADVIALAPESWKWKDRDEVAFREWIRFSKEKMLFATAVKPSAT